MNWVAWTAVIVAAFTVWLSMIAMLVWMMFGYEYNRMHNKNSWIPFKETQELWANHGQFEKVGE